MKTSQDIVNRASARLIAIAENPMREARLLLAHVLRVPYEEVFFSPENAVSSAQEAQLEDFLVRRLNHEPLSKIIEFREFWSLPFRVTRDTLDPRPDSETVIEAVLQAFPDHAAPLKILDLGTGTGCLLLSLLHEYSNAWGVGVDASEAAALVAQENAVNLRLADRAGVMVGNWGDALRGGFDIIVSNPPYIAPSEMLQPEVALYDPPTALYGGADGLDCYRAIVAQIPFIANIQGAHVFFELGAGQFDAVSAIVRETGFVKGEIGFKEDLQGIKRCLIYSIYNYSP